jgi:hypothetical protein
MKKLFMTTAIIEIATGIALLTVPALLASILLGGDLDTSAGLAVARLAGAALLSLGVACWFGSRDVQSRAAIGIVAAMLLYNLAAVVLLVSLRYGVGMTGMGLLPASALHAALAVWCIACLRAAWLGGILRSDRVKG